jgi:hypothetical protein
VEGACLFKRPHHQRIAKVLEALDGSVLAGYGVFFGGGTAIALRYGEYRESVDIDFLVSDVNGYREIRQRVNNIDGMDPLLRVAGLVKAVREFRTDQYGIRTLLAVDGFNIKFEIIKEGYISLAPAGPKDLICGVPCLTPLDMATCKLMANADRWPSDAIYSRDLIDLAMMHPGRALLGEAIQKAQVPYGRTIEAALAKAADKLRTREGWMEKCMAAMKMDVPKAVLWQRLKDLGV